LTSRVLRTGVGELAARICLYEGTVEQCQAIVALERDAFGEADYPPAERVADVLQRKGQRAWLAYDPAGRGYVGFVTAFETQSLLGHRVEIDLLAVHEAARGRGLGSSLVEAAVESWEHSGAHEARALVRLGNCASERAFERAGLQPSPHVVELLSTSAPLEMPRNGLLQARLANRADLERIVTLWPGAVRDRSALDPLTETSDAAVFVLRQGRRLVGFVELLEIHTVAYSGVWIESLVCRWDDPYVVGRLLAAADEWVAQRGLHLMGALVDMRREALRSVLIAFGFHSAGQYRFFTATRRGVP